MKKIVTCLLLGAASLKAAASPPPSYDADLFRKDKKVIFVNAEFLYWTVNEPGLDYALSMKQPAWGPSSVYANGDFKRGDFGWDPGVRVNVGYFNAPHYWDAYLQYTHLKCTGDDSTHAPTEEGLFLTGTWPHPDPTASVGLEHATSHLEFKYNIIDFLASRRYHPNPHFRMKLIGGTTGGWLRQNWVIRYHDLSGNRSRIRNDWRFFGVGLRTGLGLDWYLGKMDVYLTGLATGAVLAGYYHNISKETSSFSGAGFDPAIPMRNTRYADTRLVVQGQILAGPSWQKAFKTIRTELFAGYELTCWSNLHELYRSTNGSSQASKETWQTNGMVVLQGMTVRLNLDF